MGNNIIENTFTPSIYKLVSQQQGDSKIRRRSEDVINLISYSVLISANSVCLSKQKPKGVGIAKYEALEHVVELLFLFSVRKSQNLDVIDAVVTGEEGYRDTEGRRETK